MPEAYIVAALRTAGGRRKGRLANVHPADLAVSVLNALVKRSDIDPAMIEDVITLTSRLSSVFDVIFALRMTP